MSPRFINYLLLQLIVWAILTSLSKPYFLFCDYVWLDTLVLLLSLAYMDVATAAAMVWPLYRRVLLA